jgi:hypothetical protein
MLAFVIARGAKQTRRHQQGGTLVGHRN